MRIYNSLQDKDIVIERYKKIMSRAGGVMTFISGAFYIFLVLIVVLYYCLPMKDRWWLLMFASIGFYAYSCKQHLYQFVIFVFLVLSSYFFAQVVQKVSETNKFRKWIFGVFIAIDIFPLFFFKEGNLIVSLLK